MKSKIQISMVALKVARLIILIHALLVNHVDFKMLAMVFIIGTLKLTKKLVLMALWSTDMIKKLEIVSSLIKTGNL